MNNSDNSKKMDKLNIRLSEHEKQMFEIAAKRTKSQNVSSWAREVLLKQAHVVNGKSFQNLAISIFNNQIMFCPESDIDQAVIIPAVAAKTKAGNKLAALGKDAYLLKEKTPDDVVISNIVQDGYISDSFSFKAILNNVIHDLCNEFDFSNASVVISCRFLETMKESTKKYFSEINPHWDVYFVEFSMSCAIGLDLSVTDPLQQPILCISDDWSEIATIYAGAGLGRSTLSLGSNHIVEEIENKEVKAINLNKMITWIKEHLEHVNSSYSDTAKSRTPLTICSEINWMKETLKMMEQELGIKIQTKNHNKSSLKGSIEVIKHLNRLVTT